MLDGFEVRWYGNIIADFIHVSELFLLAPCFEMGVVAADVLLAEKRVIQLFRISFKPVIEPLLKCQARNFEAVHHFGKIADDLEGVLPFAGDEFGSHRLRGNGAVPEGHRFLIITGSGVESLTLSVDKAAKRPFAIRGTSLFQRRCF